MNKSTLTIKDIAKLLGISKSTVSRALTEHSDVNAETREKVLAIARQYDYQPNAIAQNLKQQRTNTLGVIVPDTVNRFFSKAVGGIQKIAYPSGYNIMICQSNESYVMEKSNIRSAFCKRRFHWSSSIAFSKPWTPRMYRRTTTKSPLKP